MTFRQRNAIALASTVRRVTMPSLSRPDDGNGTLKQKRLLTEKVFPIIPPRCDCLEIAQIEGICALSRLMVYIR